MTESASASPCPVCNETVALDERGGIRWHQYADAPPGSYHLLGCAGSCRSAKSGILPADTADTAPRYTWIVCDGDDEPRVLLGYRWSSRKDALETAEHWLHHTSRSRPLKSSVEAGQ
jgi:hypothetical protein